MKHGMIFAALLIGACSTSKPVQDRPVTVKVPVAVPCALERPPQPLPLPGHWASLDVRQKAAAIGKWALEWQEYGQQINAATAACP